MTKPDGSPVDFIGKYETLDEDWRKVLEHIGLPYIDLPVVNTSRAPAQEAVELDSDLLNLLFERYRGDYELGNYELLPPGIR